MEMVGDITLCSQTYHLVHHIATTGHDKAHVIGLAQNLRGCFDKYSGPFCMVMRPRKVTTFSLGLRGTCIAKISGLRGSTALCTVVTFEGSIPYFSITVRRVRLLTVMMWSAPIHAIFFYGKYRGIDIAAASVEVGGMNVNDQRFSGNLLGMNAGRIGEPVVRMDNVTRIGASYHTGYNRIVVYLFKEVIGITARKLDAPEVVGMQIIKIGINMSLKSKYSCGFMQ